MALPQTINVATPASSDAPSGGPALFQNIKQFIVDVFGITNNTAYQLQAMAINPTTGVVTISQSGFGATDLALAKGVASGSILTGTATWNNGGTTFNAVTLNITDSASAAGSSFLDCQASSVSKFVVRKDGTITTGIWGGTSIGIAAGGTGITSTPSNGQVLIGNGTGYTLATLTGNSNQVSVTNGAGSITLATPQNIHTAATPTFTSLTLSANTNQLTLGTGTTGVVTMAALSAGRTWTLPNVTGTVITTGNLTDITALGTVTSGTWQASVLNPAYGGTGISSYTAGDLLTATGATTLSKLAKGTANQVLGMNSGATTQEYKSLVQGSNVTITHGAGTITISAADAPDQSLPAGVIMEYGGAAAPTGWLLCDGAAVSRTTYAALFTAVGTTFGAGNGSTTFNVPDFKGRSPMGAGAGAGLTSRTLGQQIGAETDALPNHVHSVSITSGQASAAGGTLGGGVADATLQTHTHSVSGNTGNPSTNPTINTVQPTLVVNFIIKT